MPLGPGKYDDLATHAREASSADAVIVIVVNGDKGSGFSVQTNGTAALKLPALLRILADAIEQDMA
jgi:hypothetical protein